ncbi:MAG: PEP-CTERM sorting domain-containing protein [Betaproteobacteria bacterium]
MPRNRILISFATLVLAASLGITGATEAAVYSGRFDPIEFSGDFLITIPDACLAGTAWHANNADCAVTLNSATATVHSTSPDPVFDGVLTFAPPEIPDIFVLLGVYIVDGKLDSFDTGRISFVSSDHVTTDSWDLQFSSGHAFVSCDFCAGFRVAAFVETPSPVQPPKGVYLYANGVQSGPATYTDITLVPEPATLPLVGGALLAGWVLRRRSTSASRR